MKTPTQIVEQLEAEHNPEATESLLTLSPIALRKAFQDVQFEGYNAGMLHAKNQIPDSASIESDDQNQVEWSEGYNAGVEQYRDNINKVRDSLTTETMV